MHVDDAIRHLGDKQLQLVTTKQLLGLELSRGQISRRFRDHALFRGVYLIAGAAPSFEQLALAACLACGDGAFISSVTAAVLWKFIEATDELHITVPVGRRSKIERIEVHRSKLIGFPHSTRFGAFPIATPARTLLECAGALSERRLELAVDQAVRTKRITAERLLEYTARDDVRRFEGIAVVRKIAEDRASLGTPESALETLALRLFKDYGLPEPTRQFACVINGRSVRFDFAYPDRHVAIELDGRAPHLGLEQWQSDHDRHNAIEGSGWTVLRFTWHDVNTRPMYVVLTIAEALRLRPRGWFIEGTRTSVARQR